MSELPDFSDAQVQAVYQILADAELVPPTGEHWEGYAARRIVAALRNLPPPAPAGEVCFNCETALPKGCEGLFLSDGAHCRLNGAKP